MAFQNPGKILLDHYMKPGKLSQNALARAIGVPPRRINEIILGKRAITADTAVRLGIYFGNSASYWMHIQSEHDIGLAREKIGPQLNRIKTPYPDEAFVPENEEHSLQHQHLPPDQQTRNIKKRIMR